MAWALSLFASLQRNNKRFFLCVRWFELLLAVAIKNNSHLFHFVILFLAFLFIFSIAFVHCIGSSTDFNSSSRILLISFFPLFSLKSQANARISICSYAKSLNYAKECEWQQKKICFSKRAKRNQGKSGKQTKCKEKSKEHGKL